MERFVLFTDKSVRAVKGVGERTMALARTLQTNMQHQLEFPTETEASELADIPEANNKASFRTLRNARARSSQTGLRHEMVLAYLQNKKSMQEVTAQTGLDEAAVLFQIRTMLRDLTTNLGMEAVDKNYYHKFYEFRTFWARVLQQYMTENLIGAETWKEETVVALLSTMDPNKRSALVMRLYSSYVKS